MTTPGIIKKFLRGEGSIGRVFANPLPIEVTGFIADGDGSTRPRIGSAVSASSNANRVRGHRYSTLRIAALILPRFVFDMSIREREAITGAIVISRDIGIARL